MISCRIRRLAGLFVFLGLAAASAAAEPLDRGQLLKIVEAAEAEIATPEALAIYPEFRDECPGTLKTDDGELQLEEELSLSRRATAEGQLVLTYGSDNLKGEHSTDIITRDAETGLLKRVRLLSDGTTERLTGVPLFTPEDEDMPIADDFQIERIQWFGPVEKNGQATGETALALESLQTFEGEFFKRRSITWSRRILRDERVVRSEHIVFNDNEEVQPLPELAEKPSGLGGLLKSWFGKKEEAPVVEEPEEEAEPVVHEFEKLNFRFTHPEGRYIKMDAAAISPDATLALMQARPSRMLMIIAEELGTTGSFNLDSLTQVVRANMQSMNPAVKLGDIQEIERDAVPHRLYSSEAPLQNGRTGHWCHLISMRQGFAYQLVLFSMDAGRADLEKDIAELARNFEIIDPNRVGRSPGMAASPRYEAPAYGLTLDTSALELVPWDERDLAANFPAASFGAIALSGGGLFVVPADLRGIEVSQDLVGQVLRNLAGLAPDTPGMKVEPHKQGLGEGSKATTSYDFQNQRYTQQVRVLTHGDRALALAAFAPGDGPETTARLEAMLDLAEIAQPSAELEDAGGIQADIVNQFGLALHGRGESRAAIPFYEEARRRSADNPVYALNLLQALHDSGLFEEGLRQVESLFAEQDEPGDVLRSWHAAFLGAVGRNPESIEVYQTLFAKGWRNDDDFLNYLQILSAAGETEKAVEAVDGYIEEHAITSLNVLRWRREIYTQAGRWDQALKIARSLSEAHPADAGLRLSLVSAMIDAGKGKDALALLDEEDFGSTEEAALLFHRGRAHNLEREFVKAKEALEKAAAEFPAMPGLQDELDLATAMLGQGDQSSIRSPLEPVAIPPALTEALARHAPASEAAPGFPYRIDLSVTGFHYQPGSTFRRTEHREVTILTRAGLEEYRNIRFTFDPSYERAYVDHLEVLDPAGKVTSTGQPADYYVSSGTGGLAMATGERTVTAPVPGLSIGDRIRYSYTTESKATLDEFPFERLLFAAMTPSGPRGVFLSGDTSGVRDVIDGEDITSTKGEDFRYWLLPEPPRFEFEELLPDLDHFLPSLTLGPASGSWETLGREYLESLDDRLVAAPAIREKAAAFKSEHPDEQERILAILRFVQSQLTYQAIEFGRRARIPNKAEDCLRDRYGDCKDHSLLAHLLLREAGINSQLVLVNTAAAIEPSLPSLDQFDHMIVRVGGADDGHYYDGTTKHRDSAQGLGSVLAGRHCLVLFEDAPALEEIPAPDPAEHRVATDRRVRYEREENEFQVEETTRFHGEQAEWVRSYFSGADRSQHADVLTRLLGSDHRLRIDEVEIEGLDPHDPELVLALRYRIINALQQDEGRLSGPLPVLWEEFYFKAGASAKRKSPFELRATYEFASTCHFEVPEEDSAPPSWRSAEASHPWGKWSVSADAATQSASLTIARGVFPKEDFAEYRNDQSEYLKALRARLTLRSPEAE